jgi:hypothetical protein
MKKILIDIYHLPQFNFLKNVILQFEPDEVDICCVNRGKLYPVIQHELPGYHVTCLGDYKHNKGPWSMTFKIILPRLIALYRRMKKDQHKVILTAHYQANFIARLKGITNFSFIDDPRKLVFPILKFSADELYLPPFRGEYPGAKVFNALKEWAYLSPKYFTPSAGILERYQLQPKRYLFIREVSTKTSNYLEQQEDSILSIANEFPADWPVVLSLENKEKAGKYPKNWILLEEPVPDIHSLMYYSQVVISSGDSMAREGAMLGVPSIYAGVRDMPANDIMIARNMLWKVAPEAVLHKVKELIEGRLSVAAQDHFRQQLFREWDDITALVKKKIEIV